MKKQYVQPDVEVRRLIALERMAEDDTLSDNEVSGELGEGQPQDIWIRK